MKRLALISVAAALTITALASCTDDDPDDPPPPTTTSPTQADEEVLEQLANDWFEASRDIGVEGETVDAADVYLTNGYLNRFRAEIERREAEGLVVQRDPNGRTSNEIEAIAVDGDRATVTQCIVDADLLVQSADDEVVDDSVTTKRYITEAARTDNGWRFSSRATADEWEGQVRCVDS